MDSTNTEEQFCDAVSLSLEAMYTASIKPGGSDHKVLIQILS